MTLGEFREKTKHLSNSIRMLAHVNGEREDYEVDYVFEAKNDGLQTLTKFEIEEEKAEGGHVEDYDIPVCLLLISG